MPALQPTTVASPPAPSWEELLCEFDHYFAVEFSLWDGQTGDLLRPSGSQPLGDALATAGMVQAIERRGQADFIFDRDGLLALAIPTHSADNRSVVATAWFVTRAIERDEPWTDAVAVLGCSRQEALGWAQPGDLGARPLKSLAAALRAKRQAEADARRSAHDLQVISENLATTYEEISLLHSVTQNLKISSSEAEIGQLATEWLAECLPAEAFAVQYDPRAESDKAPYEGVQPPDFFTSGDCPVDNHTFTELVQYVDLHRDAKPYVANANVTERADWRFPRIRQVIIVPLSEGSHVFGWLAAFNHRQDKEFGTIEAQLLNSLGALLGIHGSNRQLYREQSEFVANVVRALVSALDAKDPYTSGHSDRVSRIAVRIALEMRCNPKTVNTIYMAGLLHDVGKIGIDDSVLRKAGRLTDQEFEHIKLHPEMGYRILADLKQLKDVLPAVLHHHEQWDGGGYPHGLKGEETPLIARIMAVADAYDAMTSDRPYRKGMSIDKVEQTFRDGAGSQWDANVVKAFLAAKEDIAEIAARERTPLMEHWV